MTEAWYYAVDHQRHGPVTADDLGRLYQAGRVSAGTPVWHAGLTGWRPLSEFAGAFALQPMPPPLPASAPAIAAPPPRRGLHWIWIVLLVLAGLSVPVLAILAAIALPAYNDYTARARIAETLGAAEPLKQAIAEATAAGACPRAGQPDAGGDSHPTGPLSDALATLRSRAEVGDVRIGVGATGECELEVRFGHGAERRVSGARILWALDKKGGWHCSSDAPTALLPARCRS